MTDVRGCLDCGGKGRMRCPVCQGYQRIRGTDVCPHCGGLGKSVCSGCDGRGRQPPHRPHVLPPSMPSGSLRRPIGSVRSDPPAKDAAEWIYDIARGLLGIALLGMCAFCLWRLWH